MIVDARTQGKSSTAILSVMMFLQFFLWGAWFVTLAPFMGARGFEGAMIGNAYSVAPLAAIITPVFLGIIADRFFASQKVMGVLHFLGGLLLIAAPSVADGGKDNVWFFIGVLLLHMLCYMPTLGLTNTIAFNAMKNPEKQFPIVRVWGTIGWIAAGILVGFVARKMITAQGDYPTVEAARNASSLFFYVGGVSGLVLGLFSFMLPNTPPPMADKPANISDILGLDAIKLLGDRSFLIFAICSTLICIPLAAYYSFAGVYAGAVGLENVPFKMSFGQMSEILFMLVMPLCFARLGVKWMLAVGMLAWIARYAFFSAASSGFGSGNAVTFVLAGIILHGICYDFFFVTGQIYTEKFAPTEMRAKAQCFLVLLTQGVGMLIGNQVFGRLVDHYTTTTKGADGAELKTIDWTTVWMFPTLFAAGVLVLFVLAFSGKAAAKVAQPGVVPAK